MVDHTIFGLLDKGAVLSRNGLYRFRLWRRWSNDGSPVNVDNDAVFIMLNPSTADHLHDDATIRRCVAFAKDWGCTGINVVNLFAYRTRDPSVLKSSPRCQVEHEDNDSFILGAHQKSAITVCAWGAHGNLHGRDQEVLKFLRATNKPLHYLALTKNNLPKHPLYLRKDLKPQPFEH